MLSIKLTVLFKEPFWIGVFEEEEGEFYRVCKITFGAEPREGEVLKFILKNYYKLRFSERETNDKNKLDREINPKRMQRKIRKELQVKTIGNKAQNAMKKQFEENKLKSKKHNKEKRELEEKRKFQMKQIKRKEKHKGH